MSLLRRILGRLPRPPPSCKKDKNCRKSNSAVVRLEHLLTAQHVLYVAAAFLAWVVNTFNSFLVTLSLRRLCVVYGVKSIEELTMALTYTETSRVAGAVVFGLLADRFGRRWPLTLNFLAIGSFTLGTAFVHDYTIFLVIRVFFSFCMGGSYGTIVALALENLPAHTRGFLSGFLNAGYNVGDFLAVAVDLIMVSRIDDWRVYFYVGSGAAFFAAILCAFCPDSECFIRLRREPYLYPDSDRPSMATRFRHSFRSAASSHWKRVLWCIFLMTGFHGLSHITQDIYQSFAMVEKGFSVVDTQRLIMIGTSGSFAGAIAGGSLSQPLGRRVTMIIMCISAAGFVPLWILPSNFTGLGLGYFWLRFSLQGAWGVLPIYISEISPPGCLATFVGITYTLGEVITLLSPPVMLYAAGLTEFVRDDMVIFQYGLTQAILFGILGGAVVLLLLFGDEEHGIQLPSVGVLRQILLVSSESGL